MKVEKPPGGPEVGRPGDEPKPKWEFEPIDEKLEFDETFYSLKELAKDDYHNVRTSAAKSLGELGKLRPDKVLPILKKLAKDDNLWVRETAAQSLGEICKLKTGKTLPTLSSKDISQNRDVIELLSKQNELLKDIKSGLQPQRMPSEEEQKELSKIQKEKIEDGIIEELSGKMEKDPDKHYAISISERKIVASDTSEWDLLNRLGHNEVIKIGPKEYSNNDIFIFCPNEIWFE